MVNIREKVFLIAGTNFPQRQRAVESIKKRILKGRAAPLNVFVFYGKETNIKNLGEKLFTASMEGGAVAVFKNSQDLPAVVREFLFKNLKRILSANYLIFETDKDYYQFQRDKRFVSDKFFSSVLKKAALFRVVSVKEKSTLEDFISSIRKNDLAASVYILEELFKGASSPKSLGPQIIGILVQKFSYLSVYGEGSFAKKDKYFRYLWEADRAIKEKGLDPLLVIETLLARVLSPAH